MIQVNGDPMVIQSLSNLPKSKSIRIIYQKNLKKINVIKKNINKKNIKTKYIPLNKITDGQASTCMLGLNNLNKDESVIISACDSSMIYNSTMYNKLMLEKNIDVIVWGIKN